VRFEGLPNKNNKILRQGYSSFPVVPSKGVVNMKFTINGKKLKSKIESALLKGKWNNGVGNKNDTLNTSIVISISNDSYICNGDHSSYVKTFIEIEENFEAGRIAVDTDVLLKYLSGDDTTLSLKENVLTLVSDSKKVTIPIIERHEYNEAILEVTKNYTRNIDMEKEISISPKTQLKTRVKVITSELQDAIKSCEVVGNSVIKLDYDGEDLLVSSTKDNETVCAKLETVESLGPKATMEFSAPFYKYLEGVSTILSFNDDSPLSVISGAFTMLRAPRVEL
jgi:predicted nucleic-acid-binding protein